MLEQKASSEETHEDPEVVDNDTGLADMDEAPTPESTDESDAEASAAEAEISALPVVRDATRDRASDLRKLFSKYIRRHLPQRNREDAAFPEPPRMVGSYARLLPLIKPATNFDLPADGLVRFYLLTTQGVYVGDAIENNIPKTTELVEVYASAIGIMDAYTVEITKQVEALK